jgi:predicted Zn-dependent protease
VTLALLLATSQPHLATGVGLDQDERRARLLYETREGEAGIAARGELYGDAALDAYLQSVMNRVDPDLDPAARVRALRCDDANAFSVATGNVYVCVGLLLRLRDEAELAAVLGHEGGHVDGDHLYLSRLATQEIDRGRAITAAISARAVGMIFRNSTMTAMSREIERNADSRAFDHLKAAGYETAAGTRVFERISREVEARGIKEPPYVYADHPRLRERAEAFAALAAAAPGGERREAEFLAATQEVRRVALRAVHDQRDSLALIALLEDDGQAARYAPEGLYFLGEGYRMRSKDGDDARALAQYDHAIESHPDFAETFAARGRLHARMGNRTAAIADLEHFLAVAAERREAAFARQTLTRLRSADR